MEYHLERELRLLTEPEHKSLYAWAINEIDAQGRQRGGDQIPWQWTLSFTATSCMLGDSIEIRQRLQFFKTAPTSPETAPPLPEIVQRQIIRIQLRPWDDQTTFSMFGADRAIKNFQLEVRPLASPTEQEHCRAWGSVSYTTDDDFGNNTEDDCIIFHFFVRPETFACYEAKIAHGSVDEIILSVGSVDGFYSKWSPLISTHNVKVLTEGSEQKITSPPGNQIDPPRLGHIGDAELHINRRLEFGKRAPAPEAVGETANFGTVRIVPETQTPAVVDPQMLRMLGSLRQAAWFVVGLLALIFSVTLLKR